MPEFQVLPAVPTFGSQLGQGLGQGFGSGLNEGLSMALSNMLERKKQEKKMSDIFSALGISPQQQNPSGRSLVQSTENTSMKPLTAKALELTPEKVAAVSMIDPNLGKVFATLHETQQRTSEKEKEFQRSRSTKYLDKISAAAEGLPERRIAVNSAKTAIQSGEMQPFGGDFWADVLHAPQLKSASGAALATAAKTNLIGSLSQISGARPNQFIEQQIDRAFAKAGQTKEANMAQMDIIEAKLDIDEKVTELANQMADEYAQQLGYVPENIDREVQKAVKPYAENRMKELAYDLQRNIEASQKPQELQKLKHVPVGTPLTVEKAQILLEKAGGDEQKAKKIATALGYEIPAFEIYSRRK